MIRVLLNITLNNTEKVMNHVMLILNYLRHSWIVTLKIQNQVEI